MASDRQFAANRRNAARSTGPRTLEGKSRARRNAYRHGLTAETVIVSLEQGEEYRTFEAGLFDDYAPETLLEQELVARLASLLWRLRRATSIETGLFEMQGAVVKQGGPCQQKDPGLSIFYEILFGAEVRSLDLPDTGQISPSVASQEPSVEIFSERRRNLAAASTYLRLCRKNPAAMKRLGRYETALWRQVAQTLLILEGALRAKWPKFK